MMMMTAVRYSTRVQVSCPNYRYCVRRILFSRKKMDALVLPVAEYCGVLIAQGNGTVL